MAPKPHTPIDIASLRRPRRRIRSTIVTTTVVGIFLAGLTTGVVLAWRRINTGSSTDSVPTTMVSPEEASRHWKPISYGAFALKVPESATLETEADGTTTYTTLIEELMVSIGPYHPSLVGHEEEWAIQAMGTFATRLPGTLGPVSTIESIGPAYKATIDEGNGEVVHVRLLFVADTMIFIVGQGDSANVEPWPVTAAWNNIVYQGQVAATA